MRLDPDVQRIADHGDGAVRALGRPTDPGSARREARRARRRRGARRRRKWSASGRRERSRGESGRVDNEAAIDRFLGSPGLSESTRRAYAADLADFCRLVAARRPRPRRCRRQSPRRLHRGARHAVAAGSPLRRSPAGSPRSDRSSGSPSARLECRRSHCRRAVGGGSPTHPSSPTWRRSSAPSTVTTPLALRNTAILELTYSCGLRSAEVVGLRLADVDFEQEAVHVLGKGGKERVVPLGSERRSPSRPTSAMLGRPWPTAPPMRCFSRSADAPSIRPSSAA